ncbi:MAG: hypothetical protein JF570_06410 [Caulobacter sp.]|jgi:hypothetical protein|nr:hypothetical protein [Caulobacter sp.]MBW8892270.1 hypothetical protein [Burkholderiales bacterium]
MSTRIISLRVSEQCVDVADTLARELGMSRSKLVEFLIDRAAADNARRKDRERLERLADQRTFNWKEPGE